MKRSKTKLIFRKAFLLIMGLAIMSLGIAFYLKAGLGANPLTTFTHGFSRTLNISVGRSSQLIMAITMVVIFFVERKRIGIGTIVNAILTGEFINLFMKINTGSGSLLSSLFILSIGIVAFAVGLAMYVKAELGEGAIDAIMIILRDRFSINIKRARLILDIALVILGVFLGGSVGIGTVVGTLLTGPIMAKTMDIIDAN